MSNISDYLLEQQKLTKKNLEILKGINNSFFTKAEHVSVTVDNEQYIIPSFLSLESKINTLQDNFENLVNAPLTGDAAFDFNGNTQSIEVKGFANTPEKALSDIKDDAYVNFGYENNSIFKDFCTPKPYVKIDLSSLPNDIQNVNVKKFIPKNSNLLNTIIEGLNVGTEDEKISIGYEYSDIVKQLFGYEKDVDYVEYNTTYTLPIRDNVGEGTYTIKGIIKNWIDSELDEHYTINIEDADGNLNYYIKDKTLKKQLVVGDCLVTNNDKIKLLIESINYTNNVVTVKVLNGGYADLCDTNNNNADLYTLKYFNNNDFNDYKYLNVPLEEDQFVAVFIAPISRVSLIQSSWGTGVLFNVYNLKCDINGVTYYFKDYYDTFVKNVGDTLYGLTDLFDKSFINFTESDFNKLVEAKPILSADSLNVVELNKHLNNSKTVSELYNLYNQKQSYKSDLDEVQRSIDEIQSLLNSLSFTDTTQNRTVYEQQLAAYKKQKKDITSNITNIIKEISTAANDSETPVSDPKYRIRGFFNVEDFLKNLGIDTNVCKIDVQYRYKNITKATGNATTIGDDAIFSDWNIMDSIYNVRQPKWTGIQTHIKYEFPEDNTNINEVSYNQIDIPISQGETVDVRLRVLYSNGQPFVNTYSDWSDIVNVEFPSELKRNITVLDIIDDNNNDAQSNQFTTLLEKDGVTDHVDDILVDQNVTYFHQPEHIASGFYTDERRVIPLKSKLEEIHNNIIAIQDEIYGTETEDLLVHLTDNVSSTELLPDTNNTHILPSYDETVAGGVPLGITGIGIVSMIDIEHLNIEITNNSKHIVKLYAIIPGSNNYCIHNNSVTKYDISDYIGVTGGLPTTPLYVDGRSTALHPRASVQHKNSWITFRRKDALSGELLYNSSQDFTNAFNQDNLIYGGTNPEYSSMLPSFPIGFTYTGATVYPTTTYFGDLISGETGVNWTDGKNAEWDTSIENGKAYKELKPGESLNIPVIWEGYIRGIADTIQKTLSFDIRTSLYRDPINYKVTIQQSKNTQLHDAIIQAKARTANRYNTTIVNTQTVESVKDFKTATTNRTMGHRTIG